VYHGVSNDETTEGQIEVTKPIDDYSEIMLAAANGFLDEVTSIINNGTCNVNEKGGWNMSTPLILASFSNHINVVKYLLSQRDIEVNLSNDIGETALMVAASRGENEAFTSMRTIISMVNFQIMIIWTMTIEIILIITIHFLVYSSVQFLKYVTSDYIIMIGLIDSANL
jgi:hypothetical protein